MTDVHTNTKMTDAVPESFSTYFPYDAPRPAQKDGMRTIYENAQESGFTLMEGACGTGKTLTSLIPALSLVRDNSSSFERTLISTSVKQQLEAFQDEVDIINENLPEDERPFTALTLVGRADLNPYVEMGTIDKSSFYEEADRLRKNTLELLSDDEDEGYTAAALCRRARNSGRAAKNDPELPDYPYPKHPPSAPHKQTGSELRYDPFYAAYIDLKADAEDGIELSQLPTFETGLIRPTDLLDRCGAIGICPHSIMREYLKYTNIILSNYYHLFEPRTAKLITGDLFDESTFLILDEAHNLVPRVRGLLGWSTTLTSIEEAIEEVKEIALYRALNPAAIALLNTTSIDYVEQKHSTEDVRLLRETLDWMQGNRSELVVSDEITIDFKPRVSIPDLRDFSSIVSSIQNIEELESDMLGFTIGEWVDALERLTNALKNKINTETNNLSGKYTDADDVVHIPLRDPSKIQPDALTTWAHTSLSDPQQFFNAAKILGEVTHAIQEGIVETITGSSTDTIQTKARSVGTFFGEFGQRDNSRYLRQIKLTPKAYDTPTENATYDWERNFFASLHIENCLPSEEITDTLSKFGSVVLMSATIEPLDAYERIVGLDAIDEDRPVVKRSYGLEYPEENRATIGVNATPFKYQNKGNGWKNGKPSMGNEVRKTYFKTIQTVVDTTPGNVLVVMPSYSEANWVGSLLKTDSVLDAGPILIDKSNTNKQTNRMKKRFFKSNNAVLITGAHGTLTEGVDYAGDRLHSVVVCGVPIENTQAPIKEAIKTTYTQEFGDDGYEYAFILPALQKTRQSIGRVIRSNSDVGVRVFVDERYTNPSNWDSVHKFLSPTEKEELNVTTPSLLKHTLGEFWDGDHAQ